MIRVLEGLPDGVLGFEASGKLTAGVRDGNAWERIALVSDHAWMRDGLALFAWAVPGQATAFPSSDRAAALGWLTEG